MDCSAIVCPVLWNRPAETLPREQLAALQLEKLRHMLAERNIVLELDDSAKALLMREGYDPSYGARPLKRAIQKEIVQPLAMRLLQGEFHDGDTVLVDARDGQIEFRGREAAVAAG